MTTETHAASNGHAPDAQDRVLDALGNEFSAESLRVLAEAAIPCERLSEFGIRAVALPEHVPDEIDRYWVIGDDRGPGMLFEWRDTDRTVTQFRPDTPVRGSDGKDHKYVAPAGSGVFLNHLRTPGDDMPVLFVEGSKQGVSAAVWAPEGWGVVAVPGCNNWLGTDLTWADGRRIVVLFDADFATNRDVHDAAVGLKDALEVEGADEVVFARLAGARAKEGLDDVLGRRPKDKRTSYIQSISDRATEKIGRAPARRSANKYFGDNGLLARTASLAVLDGQPAALASGGMIALYRQGVFRIDMNKEPMFEKIKDLLGEEYRPQWRQTIEEFLIGELSGRGMRLPDRTIDPVLNCANCMVDLRTGDTMDHSPEFLSAVQIPVVWTPDLSCPTYEAWLYDVAGNQGEALEEIAATMLDPSRTPQKAAFLFGPTKSGKSTFLRIMAAIAGRHNMSAVTLHQLSQNKFMGAELYGRMLNVAADLSAAHVEDTSLFKMLTGEDPVQADRKYGKTFSFTNRALFAFSANEIPTVSETSRAYVQRIAPFSFGSSFAGHEDPRIEDVMIREELPGILARWASAWRRFTERGLYLPADPSVQEEFETSSDRVARWVMLRCDVHPDAIGKMVGPNEGDTVSSLYTAFKIWAKEDSPANVMSRPKFSERLRTISGVGEVRLKHKSKNLGLNVTTHTGEDRERIQAGTTHTPADSNVNVQKSTSSSGVGGVGKKPSPPIRMTIECAISEDDHGKVNATPIGGDGFSPTPPTPTHTPEDEKRDHGRSDDGSERVHGSAPGTAQHEPAVDRPDGSASHGTDDGSRSSARSRGSRQGEAQEVSPNVPEGDSGSGIPGGSRMIEEHLPDPFADHAPPASGEPVGLDLEAWDAEDLYRHTPEIKGSYVRLVGAGPERDVATGGLEVLERISGRNTLVGHNLALFDLPALDVHEGIPVEDTIPRAHDLRFCAFQQDPPTSYETKSGPGFKHYNLQSLLNRYLGEDKSDLGKLLAKEYGGWGNIAFSDRRYHDYCTDDVQKALALAQVLPMTDYDRREMEVASITARATIQGFRLDMPALEIKIAEQAEQLAAGRAMLVERFGFPLTTKDGKKISKAPQRTAAGKLAFEAALTAFDVDLEYWTRGKDRTLSLAKEVVAEALEGLSEIDPDHPALPVIKAVQEMNGLRSNAANLFRRAVGDRIHQNFEPFQATGRWSAGNLTTLKKAAEDSDRVFLLPDEGHVLVSFDADQVDIRCVAAHSQDPGLMDLVNDPDRDIHSEISDLAFGRHDDPYRFHTKSMDIGWFYGRSVNGLALTPGVPDGAAERVDEAMRRQFNTVPDWQHEVRRAAEGRTIFDNGFGRNLRCDEGKEYTQAPAFKGQSMTRDVVAEGLLTMKRNHPELIPMLRVIVHDEIVMNIPETDVEDVARMVISDMTQEIHGVRFTWGRSPAGRTWAECYRK